jgi:hypothetical protein
MKKHSSKNLLDDFLLFWDERLLRRKITTAIPERMSTTTARDTPIATPKTILLLFFLSPVRPESICFSGMKAVAY